MTQSDDSNQEQEQEQSHLYGDKWRAFALRHHLALFLLYGWLPACAAFFLVSRYWLHQPEIMAVLMAIWLVLLFATVWWAGQFRCPRCRRRYAALGSGRSVSFTRGLFDKICPNCHLAKFETFPQVGEPTNTP
jgi:Flp pilus assembly protein TadB